MDNIRFAIFLIAFLVVITTVLGSKEKTHYDVLGVEEDASEAQIKKVYKKLVLKYHPDKAPKDKKKEHQEKFIKINTAYEILSDPEKRKRYDRERKMQKSGFGGFHEGGNNMFGGDSMFGGGGFNEFFMHFPDPFQSDDFGDPFMDSFGRSQFAESRTHRWSSFDEPEGHQAHFHHSHHGHHGHGHGHHGHSQNCQVFIQRVGNTVRKQVQCY